MNIQTAVLNAQKAHIVELQNILQTYKDVKECSDDIPYLEREINRLQRLYDVATLMSMSSLNN